MWRLQINQSKKSPLEDYKNWLSPSNNCFSLTETMTYRNGKTVTGAHIKYLPDLQRDIFTKKKGGRNVHHVTNRYSALDYQWIFIRKQKTMTMQM